MKTKDAPQGNIVASWPRSTGKVAQGTCAWGRTRHAEDWDGTLGDGHKDTSREGWGVQIPTPDGRKLSVLNLRSTLQHHNLYLSTSPRLFTHSWTSVYDLICENCENSPFRIKLGSPSQEFHLQAPSKQLGLIRGSTHGRIR